MPAGLPCQRNSGDGPAPTSARVSPIKPYVAKYPTVTFINVEPYKLKLVSGTLQADLDAKNELQEAPATEAWKLVIEPQVFVIHRDGVITADFELIFSDAELTAALDAIR